MGKSGQRLQRAIGSPAAMFTSSLVAITAWGVVAALFVPDGWARSDRLAPLVGGTLRYLLPVLIGYAGGRRVHGARGGLLGAAATMGLAAGTELPMLLGAMLVGPLGGWAGRQLDRAVARLPERLATPAGELSAVLLAAALLAAGAAVAGPVMRGLGGAALAAAGALVSNRLFPVAELVLTPARILFLDAPIQQRVLFFPGFEAVASTGRGIQFLLCANPGPAFGLLLAFAFAGRGPLRRTAPVAALVQLLGGIPAIAFFHVLAHPLTLLALLAGGVAANGVFTVLHAGLVGAPAPPSLQATLALTPPGLVVQVVAGMVVGAVVSFAAGAFILRRVPVPEVGEAQEGAGAMLG